MYTIDKKQRKMSQVQDSIPASPASSASDTVEWTDEAETNKEDSHKIMIVLASWIRIPNLDPDAEPLTWLSLDPIPIRIPDPKHWNVPRPVILEKLQITK